MARELRVVTLNCWGLWYLSHHRSERMGHLGDELARRRYDIVTLQEVWMEKDYREICDKVKKVLPYHHYFHSGVIGSGMCILSKWPIVDTFFHRYSVNSYAYRYQHGDWFGGKGLGMCVIEMEGLTINVYTTHNVALYGPSNRISADEYFTHRLVQSFELSEFIRYSGTNSNLNLVTGDFNTEDDTLALRVSQVNGNLKDAWVERLNQSEDQPCCTVEPPDNCYTYTKTRCYVEGSRKRIDYILYRGNPGCRVTCPECSITFEKIPGTKMHYSDHNGVEALFELQEVKDDEAPEPSKEDCVSALLEILPYVTNAIQDIKQQRVSYILKSLLIFLLLASLWLSGMFHGWTGFCARAGALLVFVALVLLGAAGLCVGGSVKTTELNQLVGRKRDITLRIRRLEGLLRQE